MLGTKSKIISDLILKARVALRDCRYVEAQQLVNKINVLFFSMSRAIHVYIHQDDIEINISESSFGKSRLSGELIPRYSSTVGFVAARITKYYVDGRIEVIKDRTTSTPRWIVEHTTQGCLKQNNV